MAEFRAALAIALMSGITVLIRYIPFLAFGGNKKTPEAITNLGKVLPYSIMAMLVVYCLREMTFLEWKGFFPQCTAVILVVFLQVYKRNTLLSIAAGTALYMFLVQTIF